jgi:geranylgeranyl pyrophosphate synthase
MAGGQAIDLAAVGQRLAPAALEDMHARKTGALIGAAVELGTLATADATPAARAALAGYARAVGLAFQIVDDILDVEGDTATLGKTAGADQARAKPTYPALLGLDGARARARALHEQARASLAPLGAAGRFLAELADFILERRV